VGYGDSLPLDSERLMKRAGRTHTMKTFLRERSKREVMKRLLLISLALVALLATTGAAGATSSTSGAAAVPAPWNNCTQVHTRYAHGVGRATARDRVRGTTAPVTTFKRSTPLYNLATRYNSGLDRDKDGVACEQR
jgi:hypothetical protein